MKISFVIPLFNEEKRIEKSVGDILAFREKFPHESEWIFVDDGSTDQTEALAKKKLGSMPYRWIGLERNEGKGGAVRKGMLEAKGDYLFFSDADLSTPLSEYEPLLKALGDGFDLALASRGRGARVLVHQSWLRERMGRIFNRLARSLTFKDVRDSQCGFKGFRRSAAHRLFSLQKIKGFSFDAEIIFLAQELGYRITEIPVTWINVKDSRVRMFRDSLQMIRDLFRIRWLHRGLKRAKQAVAS